MLCIKVIDKNGLTINVRRDENEVHLPLFHEYQGHAGFRLAAAR